MRRRILRVASDSRAGGPGIGLSLRWRLFRHVPENRPGDVGPAASAGLPGVRSRSRLDRVVFSGFDPAGELKPQLAESAAQGVPGDPQPTGGLNLIPAHILQDASQ